MANRTKSAFKKGVNGEPYAFAPFSNRPFAYYLRKAKARCSFAPGNRRAIFRNEPVCRFIAIFVTKRSAIGGTKLQILSGIPNRTAVHFRYERPRAKHHLGLTRFTIHVRALFSTGGPLQESGWIC
jgi:hypothetical protein